MNIRKLLFVIVAVCVVGGNAFAADTIKMGYFMLPPLQYADDAAASPKGASVVYFEAAASKMGYEVEWVGPLPLLRLSEMLKSGEIDGAVGFNKFSTLADFLYYTDEPLFFAQPSLMIRKENPLTQITSIEDIRGYRIGLTVSIAGIYTPLIDEHRDALILETLGGEHLIEQNIKKLLVGRLDAVFDRQPYSIGFIAVQLHVDEQVKVLPIPDHPTPMHVVFSRASKRGEELLRQYNSVISQLELNHDELTQKEFEAAAQRP